MSIRPIIVLNTSILLAVVAFSILGFNPVASLAAGLQGAGDVPALGGQAMMPDASIGNVWPIAVAQSLLADLADQLHNLGLAAIGVAALFDIVCDRARHRAAHIQAAVAAPRFKISAAQMIQIVIALRLLIAVLHLAQIPLATLHPQVQPAIEGAHSLGH